MKRFKEFFCTLFGHNFNEHTELSEGGIVWERIETCGDCDMSYIAVDRDALKEINRIRR